MSSQTALQRFLASTTWEATQARKMIEEAGRSLDKVKFVDVDRGVQSGLMRKVAKTTITVRFYDDTRIEKVFFDGKESEQR